MSHFNSTTSFRIFFAIALIAVFAFGFYSQALAGNLTGWAWSDMPDGSDELKAFGQVGRGAGWIEFAPALGPGVNVDASGNFSGYAWSENIGWISFNAAETSGCGANAALNTSTGVVSGFAKALAGNDAQAGGWDGCIKMDPGIAGSGVTVDGSCNYWGYAWGGSVMGWVQFNPSLGGVTGTGGACVALPTLTVSPASATIATGGTQQYTATYDPDGPSGPQAPQNVTSSALWTSADTTIASVNGTGLATGVWAGTSALTTNINASYLGLSASASITVYNPATLVITPPSLALGFGDTASLTALYDPDGPSGPQANQTVTQSASWSSSNTIVASVNNVSPNKGVVTAGAAAGSATISALYSGLTATAGVTVCGPTLTLSPTSASLSPGGTRQFIATYDPDGCGPRASTDVTSSAVWTSSNASVATVNASGLATAVSSGSASVTATYLGLSRSAAVTVTAPPLSASCSASPTATVVGAPVTWTATASGGTGSYTYSWTGTKPLNGRTGNPVTVTYTGTGTKTGSVTVVSGRQSVTRACSNSVSVGVARPDLISENLTRSIASPVVGNTMTFSGDVKNQGTASAVASTARFVMDGVTLGTTRSVASLAIGASSPTLTSDSWTATVGSHTVQLCADSGAVVAESDETNNCTSMTFAVTLPLPDLVVNNLIVVDSFGNPTTTMQVGSSITFRATVTNLGPGSAGLSSASINLDGAPFQTISNIGPLGNGSSQTINSTPWTASPSGSHSVTVCADSSGSVSESNEGNNCATTSFSVGQRPPNWCEIPSDAPPDFECPP